jgi:hypothetical protein
MSQVSRTNTANTGNIYYPFILIYLSIYETDGFLHCLENTNGVIKQEVLGRTNRLLSLIRHGPHWKRRVQQFFCCCVCFVIAVTFLLSRCLATTRGIHRQTHRLMGGIFSLLSLFWKNKSRLMRSHCWLSVCMSVYPPVIARQRFCKNLPIVARQRLDRNVTAIRNTHTTIEELLNVSFSMWPVSFQGK